jgi:putative N6-adenine-specific DNA methylase
LDFRTLIENEPRITAKTLRGLENLLADEIRSIGGVNIRTGTRVVHFEGDRELLYKANFLSRTALRILKPFYKFRARDENELYRGAYDIDWSPLLSGDKTFAIDGVLNSPYFNHSGYIALKVKDAIADQFRAKTGKRPSVDTEDPDIRINLHISGDECTLLLDSSGESLHKRGYRDVTHKAPLSEVLAAGIIMLSGWDRRSPLIDPMCGSGTIPIEAAMIAGNIPPGIYRKNFAFQKWPDYDDHLFRKIYDGDYPEPEEMPVIVGSDMSPQAIAIARQNARNAFLTRKTAFRISTIDSVEPPGPHGMLITNPPYGERIQPDNLKALYTIMGDVLKKNFTGYTAWVLSSNLDALKFIGLRPEKKLVLYNGPLECRLVKFPLYSGTKKEEK